MKQKHYILFFIFLFFTGFAKAGSYYSSPSNLSPAYWQKCVSGSDRQGRYVQKFTGTAKSDMKKILTSHFDDAMGPLLTEDVIARDDILNALTAFGGNVDTAIKDGYNALSIAEETMEKKALEKELEYMKTMSQQSMNEEMYGFFSSGNSLNRPLDPSVESASENEHSSEYKMFKSMCKRNKMVSKVGATETKLNKTQGIKNLETKILNRNSDLSSSSQNSYELVKNHYEKYCTVKDLENGICESESLDICEEDVNGVMQKYVCESGEFLDESVDLQNADLSSFNFLSPKYKIDNEQKKKMILEDGFRPNYTYNEKQKEAAISYINNTVYANISQAPSLKHKNDPSKAVYIQAYDSQSAALNLAYNSYLQSFSARMPLTEEGAHIPMSELDLIRYSINNISTSDNSAPINDSNAKSKDVSIYSMMAINNKLELEVLKKKERIRAILAALVAKEVNSPYNIEYLKSIK